MSDTPIIITGDMDAPKIQDRLGLSPLADAVVDSVQFGASRIYLSLIHISTPSSESVAMPLLMS